MQTLYLDESGDHNLEVIDPQYPVFVLGGVILDDDYVRDIATPAVQEFKQSLFGTNDILLHTADITRNKNGFENLKDTRFRQHFYAELNLLIQSLEFKVIACAIKKADHFSRYGLSAIDPYLLSLNVLIERFCFDLKEQKINGQIIAEKRGLQLDRELDLAWLNLKIQGTKFVQASEIDKYIDSLILRDKTCGLIGIELADLMVSPIGRHVIGKKTKEDFRIIESKFRTNHDGNYNDWGLVILPK